MALRRIRSLFQPRPNLHNNALSKSHSNVAQAVLNAIPWGASGAIIEVTTPPARWSNALSYRIIDKSLQALADNDALVIECKVRVHQGNIGVGVTMEDGSTFAAIERIVPAGPTINTLRIWVREPNSARHLLFRNVSPDAQPSRFELFQLSAFAKQEGRTFVASWSSPNVATIPLAELGEALSWASDVWDHPFPLKRTPTAAGTIQIVDVRDLPSLLGTSDRPEVPQGAIAKRLADWKMETDDAPILEFLWRSQAPRRHLEFGTWEGFGATLVARVTNAEIWTINLPTGETAADGTALYDSTDGGAFIGHLYRQAGFSKRVNQLLCDSREFDPNVFANNHFDTVLIDGGHTPDVVRSDTDNALRVLGPGGMCVWHDFCPDPETLANNLAPLGVVQALIENFDQWSPCFEKLFWIRKSWILVGYRRK